MRRLFKRLQERIWGKPLTSPPPIPASIPDPDPEEIVVPEITVTALQSAFASEEPPFVVDVREPYEWRQVHVPDILHIPMNDIPVRLDELPKEREIVVLCAHGSRSYAVAGYLIEQGYQASSLAGGITEWVRSGGEYQQGAEKGEMSE